MKASMLFTVLRMRVENVTGGHSGCSARVIAPTSLDILATFYLFLVFLAIVFIKDVLKP